MEILTGGYVSLSERVARLEAKFEVYERLATTPRRRIPKELPPGE